MAFTEEELLEYRTQAFIERFSEWKRVLKGEALWPHPVSIVPKYPAGLFDLPKPTHVPDWDKEAPVMMAVNRFLVSLGWGTPIPKLEPIFGRFEFPDFLEVKEIDPVELKIQFPELPKTTRGQWEALFANLAECRQVSFEIVSAESKVIVQFVCDETERLFVRKCLAEAFPGIIIREERGYLSERLLANTGAAAMVHEYGLANDCTFPIKTWQPHEEDPLTPIVDTLLSLNSGECGVFQVSFAVADWWRNNLAGLCLHDNPVPFSRVFGDTANRGSTKQKITRPFVGAVVRVGLRASPERADEIFRSLDACFRLEQSRSNFLYRLPNNNGFPAGRYDSARHLLHAATRQSCRTGMLLSHDELFSLVHLPLARAEKSRFRLVQQRTKPPKLQPIPEQTEHGGVLGYNDHRDEITSVVLSEEQRSRHTYVIGVSGTGKSTLLFSLILRDMIAGRGCAVIDPHGDLIEKLLEYVPEDRLRDVVLIDPSDEEYPVGFNILSAGSDAERNLLASDLVAVFRRLSTAWGDQMNSVLANAILAFLESPKGGTLVDLRNFLVDKEYRLKFLETVKDEGVRYYWTKEFPMLSGKPQGPILTRLDAFLRPKMIRNMVSQKANKLDFPALMNGKKIVFAKLAQGSIGAENSYLLGSLLVSRFYQAALGRQNMPPSERSLFNLYIDEFHDFITPSIASILSGGRKFGLGLTLAHQELRQLWSRDEQVASAVLANPATRVCFRVSDWDAEKLAEGFSFFKAKDIQTLGKGEAICRIDTSDNDFNLTTIAWDIIRRGEGPEWAEKVRTISRAQYAAPRAAVEVASPLPEAKEVPHIPTPLPVPEIRTPERTKLPPVQTTSQKEDKPAAPAAPGKGGKHHIYLQKLFTNEGDKYGYHAEIEKAALGGAGSVDISFERGGKKIACEISITTSADHELRNAQKCLASGYDFVALVASEKEKLIQLRELADALEQTLKEKLRFFLPEEFMIFLEEQAAGDLSTETIVRGRKVKLNLKVLTPEQAKEKKKSIGRIIAAAFKRLGKE